MHVVYYVQYKVIFLDSVFHLVILVDPSCLGVSVLKVGPKFYVSIKLILSSYKWVHFERSLPKTLILYLDTEAKILFLKDPSPNIAIFEVGVINNELSIEYKYRVLVFNKNIYKTLSKHLRKLCESSIDIISLSFTFVLSDVFKDNNLKV